MNFIISDADADEEFQSALFEMQKLLKADLLFLEGNFFFFGASIADFQGLLFILY